jgi:mediator of RNA polymerase II transcription subunit 14
MSDSELISSAMVAQSILEQQLKDRSIPYTLQAPPATGPGAPQSRAAVAGMVPALVMNVADLLKDPRAAEVARSKVYMQLKGWWKGGKCTVSLYRSFAGMA